MPIAALPPVAIHATAPARGWSVHTYANGNVRELVGPQFCDHQQWWRINGRWVKIVDFGGGPRLTDVQLVRALRRGGFTWAKMVTAVATVDAESARCPRTSRVNPNYSTGRPASTDRGLWQMNDVWHNEVTTAQAMDPVAASRAAARIQRRYGWSTWHGYDNRAQFLAGARKTVNAAYRAGVR